jgi:hypothetical protein
MMDYEAWRPALIAFYRADGWFQSAENLERGCELTPECERTIRSLAAAYQATPQRKLAA